MFGINAVGQMNEGEANYNGVNRETVPMRQFVAIITLVQALALATPGVAAAAEYLDFADKSKEGFVDGAACRSHGGRRVFNNHYDLVLSAGRSDPELYNVLYYGGRKYVTFRIDTSNFLNRLFHTKAYDKGLCQF